VVVVGLGLTVVEEVGELDFAAGAGFVVDVVEVGGVPSDSSASAGVAKSTSPAITAVERRKRATCPPLCGQCGPCDCSGR
jgi:hypothetical protein